MEQFALPKDLNKNVLDMIASASQLPIVRVDRDSFLRKEFKDSPHLDVILEKGPQAVYELDSLRRKASQIIKTSTHQTALTSFVAGLPANPFIALPAALADAAQNFAFGLHLAQKIAYLFGEDNLFEGGQSELSDEAKMRVIAYMGVMLGVSNANVLLVGLAKDAVLVAGKRYLAKPLTKKTIWYPLLKKVASQLGQRMSKDLLRKVLTKGLPVIGGLISAGLTYLTFKPMGELLADTFVKQLSGDFDLDMVLKEELRASEEETKPEDILDADFQEISPEDKQEGL